MTIKDKGQRFLNSLLKGNTITRRQAMARWKMGNPSAWIGIYVDEGFSIRRVYKTKVNKDGKRVRTVRYHIRQVQ